MGERIIFRQDSDFITEILAADPHDPEFDGLGEVHHVHQLTPYGMLMASLASCTAIVVHTYAQHHEVALDEVELQVAYDRVFAEDCEDCEDIEGYQERFEMEVAFSGDLTPQERERLYAASRHCPVHKIISNGAKVEAYLAED